MEDLNTFIIKFIDATVIHRTESEGGDYKLANKNFDIAVNCICKIKEFDGWVDVFESLLDHENASIRVSAAYNLLPFKPELAVNTLKKCTSAPRGEGFNAKTILQEWRSGDLKFPEFVNGKVVYK
ncbi:MAG: hypothetical protein ACYCWE_06100 [Eubacteriales bacterium]